MWMRCFSTLGCPEASLDEVHALAARHGVPAVELRTLGGTTDLVAYLEKTYGTPAALAARRSEAAGRPRILALNAGLRAAAPTPAERAELEALAPWADAAGARWLRVFDGGARGDAAEAATVAATLAWWEERRREYGWEVRPMVETHDAFLGAETLGRLIAAAPHAAILWDAHHTWRKGGEAPAETWRAIRGHVVHVHVKDSVPVPSARHPFTYVLPGDGGFPIGELRSVLERDGFGGALSLEWERQWHPYLPPLAEALRAMTERGWW